MHDLLDATVIIAAVISYLIGNISPSTLVAKMKGVDIRSVGSGNPGTTNTLRSVGPGAAAVTLVIDILKGVAAVLLARYWCGTVLAEYLCGTAVFLGHIWPVFYRFRGGKGIATGFGIFLALDWRIGLICLAAAVAGTVISRRMSVGSITAALAIPVCYALLYGAAWLPWALAMAGIVILRHRSNIVRMIHHEEPVLSFFAKKEAGKEPHDEK